jgi:hypothetical protein
VFCLKILVAFAAAMLAALPSLAAVSLTEDFSSDPFARWSYGIGTNDHHQFTWTNSSLKVHLDSSLPTVRFQRPLGVTLTATNDFLLKAHFSFTVISAPDDTAAQIAFGLVNRSLTGGDRSGTPENFGSDNTFHTIEFNYFPSISTFFQSGPTLTPAVFGAQIASNADAFANFASIFGSESDLGDNTNGLTALPQYVTLQAVLSYTAANKTLTLTMSQVNPDGTLTVLDTGLAAMSLMDHGYNTNFPFNIDALAIMAYRDGFTTTNNPSLVADITFQHLSFYSPSPEPPSYMAIKIASTNVFVMFPTISNCLYDVQSRTDLVAGSWSTIASNMTGTGGIMTNIDVGAATAPKRFYRIGLTVP